MTVVEVRAERSPPPWRARRHVPVRRRRTIWPRPGPDRRGDSAPPPWCRSAPDSPRSCCPWTTQLLMPSFTYGRRVRRRRTAARVLVSFSVNSSVGRAVADRGSARRASGCDAIATAPRIAAASAAGRGPSAPQDQVLRNQSVGSTCSVAASGPRLWTVIWIRMSSGDAFAYSTNTSK